MKIRIKRKNKQIIKEAMMMPMDLPEGYYVMIDYDADTIEVSYEFDDSMGVENELGLAGSVDATNLYGGCIDNVFIINTANVNIKGWGPMLYDVLIERLAEDGIAITADRSLVSEDAWKIWNYYINNRKSEFEIIRLDVSGESMEKYYGSRDQWPFKQLTPNDTSDDCLQNASMEWAAGKGDWTVYSDGERTMAVIDNPKKAANWHKQPISYAYVKKDSDDSILEELRELRMVRGA